MEYTLYILAFLAVIQQFQIIKLRKDLKETDKLCLRMATVSQAIAQQVVTVAEHHNGLVDALALKFGEVPNGDKQ